MGFNKCFLPPIESMKKEIILNGLDKFIERYQKYDALIGETDRMVFLDDVMRNDFINTKYLY